MRLDIDAVYEVLQRKHIKGIRESSEEIVTGRGNRMRVLITGGAGFVGSHVAEYYARKGYEVVVFDNLSRLIKGDIRVRDFEKLKDA